MTLPDHWAVLTYECAFAMPGFEFAAHHFERKTRKDGDVTWHSLPATSFASTHLAAADKLVTFLEAELAREAKRRDNARLAGERMNARNAERKASR